MLSTLVLHVTVSTLLPRLRRSFQPAARDRSLQNALLAAVLPFSSYSLPSSFLHARNLVHLCRLFAVMHQRHLRPCTRCTLPSLSSSCTSDTHHLDASAKCSCKKCLPMLNCLLYAVMHAWMCSLSSHCIFSVCSFVLLGCNRARKDVHSVLPFKRTGWCSYCMCSNLSWSSLVPRSQNCPSSRFAVMSMKRLGSML